MSVGKSGRLGMGMGDKKLVIVATIELGVSSYNKYWNTLSVKKIVGLISSRSKIQSIAKNSVTFERLLFTDKVAPFVSPLLLREVRPAHYTSTEWPQDH